MFLAKNPWSATMTQLSPPAGGNAIEFTVQSLWMKLASVVKQSSGMPSAA
jgi:hypothetical protein